MKRIAIQGVHGCFHEQAARLYYGKEIEVCECLTFEELFMALRDGRADAAVMAIENTIAGGLLANYSLLRKYGTPVRGEVLLPIRQNLMAMPGVRIKELQEVYSHYMAIAQTREFFARYPHIRLVESEDTAKSAAFVAAKKSAHLGAIASELAAELFGLEILAPGIETYRENNHTRFLILDAEAVISKDEIDKSSICFTLPHKTGSLSQVLSVFAFYELNLTKIQSLPLPSREWQYFFYVDLKFRDYERYREAIRAVYPLIEDLTIMGEYKSDKC